MALESRLLAEIQNWFEDFNVKLTDLQKPTYVFVRDFYCRALVEFEVDVDNVRRVCMPTTEHISLDGQLALPSLLSSKPKEKSDKGRLSKSTSRLS